MYYYSYVYIVIRNQPLTPTSMYPYKSLSKSQLIELINIVERDLSTAIQSAKESADEYSKESVSNLAYEVGHLGGSIKGTLLLIDAYKNC